MSKIAISGNASGTGVFTIASPNSSTDRTITLPDVTGTINTSGAVNEVPAGSASAPSIYSTGDTNTGPFFPAADTIAWTTGGSERARIDSSGNVGIGASPIGSDWRLTVVGGRSAFAAVSEPYSIYVRYNNSTAGYYIGSAGADILSFSTSNGTERARFTSAGEFWVAGTTDQGAYNIQCNGTAVWGAGAYVNGSDARIKEDVSPIASGLDVVKKLNPVTYRYKADWSKDQSTQTGFIAQELLTALDGQVYVDGVVQQGGTEGYYSVAYQNIIPILTKAIQELKAELDDAKVRIAALEAPSDAP